MDIEAGHGAILRGDLAETLGDDRLPLVLSLIVERDEVAALLDDREEGELLVPYACYRREDMEVVTSGHGPSATG